jgi:hypothetical protein
VPEQPGLFELDFKGLDGTMIGSAIVQFDLVGGSSSSGALTFAPMSVLCAAAAAFGYGLGYDECQN